MADSRLISILIPTRNCGDKIAATLESLRRQDASLFDCHVLDGGSPQETLDLIRRTAPDARLTSKPDGGVYHALNDGIAQSTGRFIYVLGAGDLLRPGILSRLAHRLTESPPHSMVYGDVHWMNRGLRYAGRFTMSDLSVRCICHQAMFVDRSIFALLGAFDTRYRISADWHFNIRCFADPRVRVGYFDEIIADYEGGGISDTVYDAQFQRDHAALVRNSFGIACWLRLIGHRVVTRVRRSTRRALQRIAR